MEQIESNKRYIRDNVPDRLQANFYEYFLQLPDQENFNQWSLSRTIEVVSQFNRLHSAKAEKTHEGPIESKEMSKAYLTNSIDLGHAQGNTQRVRNSASSQKRSSAISLLDEIQQSFVNTPQKVHVRSSHNWNTKHENIWVKFQPTKKIQSQQTKDIFENFDSFIQSPSKNQIQDINKPEKQSICSSPHPQKTYGLKRSQQIKRQSSGQLKHQRSLHKESEDKDKQSTAGDKFFKYKLNDQLPCRKLPDRSQDLTVRVNNHEIVHRTLLPDYAIYHINITPGSIICKRTYDDFLELNKRLEKLFPGCKIPVIDSGSWFSESDIALINSNKTALQQYLNDILSHPTLSRAQVFRDFLNITDQKKIEKILQNYNEIPPNASFSQIANQDGILRFTLSEQTYKIVENLPKWKKTYSNYYDRYIDLISNLISQYQAIKLTFSQIMTLSNDFQLKIKQSQDIRSILSKPAEMEELLAKQIEFFNKQKKQYEKDINNMKDRYLSVLKYERLNINSFEPVIDKIQSMTQNYIKRLQNQPESPSSDRQQSQIADRNTKFEPDLWHEPQSISLFKYQVAYLHAKIMEESHIFNQKLTANMSEVWEAVFERREQPSSPRNSA